MRKYETQRLVLREVDETFAENVLDYLKRNKEFLTEWEAERSENYFKLEYQKELIKKT